MEVIIPEPKLCIDNGAMISAAAFFEDAFSKDTQLDLGFKAQEVEALEVAAGYKKEDETNLVIDLTDDGTKYGIKYEKLVPILVKAIQELEARVKELEG